MLECAVAEKRGEGRCWPGSENVTHGSCVRRVFVCFWSGWLLAARICESRSFCLEKEETNKRVCVYRMKYPISMCLPGT